ncbi:hypothetical protein VTN02DRAFT_6669 [Thermoascus thermophilus]
MSFRSRRPSPWPGCCWLADVFDRYPAVEDSACAFRRRTAHGRDTRGPLKRGEDAGRQKGLRCPLRQPRWVPDRDHPASLPRPDVPVMTLLFSRTGKGLSSEGASWWTSCGRAACPGRRGWKSTMGRDIVWALSFLLLHSSLLRFLLILLA